METANASSLEPDSTTQTSSSTHASQHGLDAAKDILFGSVAGIVGKYIEFPFDTVKVRLQSQPDGHPLRYAGPIDCFRQSFQQDGIRGLYRGISAPLFGAAVETSSLFFSYRIAQNVLRTTVYQSRSELPFTGLLISGAASGAFTSLALTPIELIKCKMQVPVQGYSSGRAAPGPLALVASVYRHQGLLGFWHGQLGTLIRETGGSAAWFGSYEGVSILFRSFVVEPDEGSKVVPLPVYQQMLAGAAAGMSYNFLFFPADTIKSRMQTEPVSNIPSGRRTFGAVGRALWKQQGLRGLYQGCGITVARSAPSSAFIFAVYEALRHHFG
ncbi:MAG: hypothetical protein M1833_004325 [Piccolia ochrophora]|nr:MAG: hypothetical protein M1833_004325 [Piccolia ochrophora]